MNSPGVALERTMSFITAPEVETTPLPFWQVSYRHICIYSTVPCLVYSFCCVLDMVWL